MRDFKGMKRQRNRGRGGGGGGSGGGGKPQHNANRAFDSNGPEGVKVRGAAQHIYEKYQQLARDAGSAGDRVLAENYQQHAEHYFRVLRAMQPLRPISEIIGRDQFVSGYDIDFEDEGQGGGEEGDGEAEAAAENRQGERNGWQPREERPQGERSQGERNQGERSQGEYRQPREEREFRPREERQPNGEFRQRDDRFQGERRERFQRDDRPRDDRPRDDRPRDDRPRDDRPRDERPREDRPREDRQGGRFQGDRRPEREGRQDRGDRDQAPARDPLGVIEPQATPLTAAPAAAYEPREGAGLLRGEDGAVSHAPAFLQTRSLEPRPEAEEASGEARRPRRRRAPRSFEAGETAPAEVDEG
jgi:hypothetical protein